jgi:alanine racemase
MRLEAKLDSRALLNNYKVIRNLSGKMSMLPMVKAEAYGHGLEFAAKVLKNAPGLVGFGVATLEEGISLRNQIKNKRIIVFSGAASWSNETGNICRKHDLTPVLVSLSDWKKFHRDEWFKKISYELKFNTGMNRLGIPMSELHTIVQDLRRLKTEHRPTGILSHLAEGEDPRSSLSKKQFQNFQELRRVIKSRFPSVQVHLGNSAAIWNSKSWKLKDISDYVRPGLSLYGARPWAEARENGLKPVMHLRAKILQVHHLKKGDRVGYGGSYIAKGRESVATLGVGYADGIHRMLGHRGDVVWKGKRFPILGRVSMDLLACRIDRNARPQDWVTLLGPGIDPWQQADAAGTLPYELFTSVTFSKQRIKRIYE